MSPQRAERYGSGTTATSEEARELRIEEALRAFSSLYVAGILLVGRRNVRSSNAWHYEWRFFKFDHLEVMESPEAQTDYEYLLDACGFEVELCELETLKNGEKLWHRNRLGPEFFGSREK